MQGFSQIHNKAEASPTVLPTGFQERADEFTMFPASFAQERLWFLEQLEPGKSVHNIYEAVRFTGQLKVEVLERSINEIVRRHDVLRTVFAEVAERVTQIVIPSVCVTLLLRDLRPLGETERETEARLRATNDARQPFDLRHGPLIRFLLIQLKDQEQVLVLTMHRIVCDDVSMAIFLRELQVLYNANSESRSSPLTGLPKQYGAYADRQRGWLQGEVLEQQLSYWMQQLSGAPAAIELPTDRPRPAEQSYRGARQSLALPGPLKEQLRLLSAAQGVTLDVLLLAGFQTLLFRYCHQRDLAIGIPNAGRSTPETQNLIGPFANMLVLRTDLSAEPTFPLLLRRTQEVVQNAHSHQDLPFGALVQALSTDRNLAYAPLFQVQFAFQEAEPPDIDLTGLTGASFEIAAATSMFDLSLFVCEQPEGLLATLEYSTDLYDPSTIRRILQHFRNVLEHAVRETGVPISQWPLLTAAEQHQMLVTWNETGEEYPRDQTISQLFERQARTTPHVVAVCCDHRTLTYQQLNDRANRLARYLRARTVGPEILVGICVERSLEMIVGLLAILKAGGAYVPLDPAYPPERLAWMLEDSHAPVLLTQQPLIGMFAGYGGTVVCLDREWPEIRREKTADVASGATAENRAYVIYTSGSMGWPKGVQIAHRSVVNLVSSMRAKIGMTAEDVLLAVTTISFDIPTLDIWMPLLSGARLVVASADACIDGSVLAKEISRSGATILEATPSRWRLLLESGWQGSRQLIAICGGETLSRELASQLQDKVKTLWNAYGPTESTTWSAAHAVGPKDDEVLIGRPLANTQFYLLDSHRQPVPIGVSGELYIAGDGLSVGYLNLPELTAEKFVSNPFDASGRTRFYRTGDRARYRADGNVEFLGRLDHQVKLRGFRIELDEISEVLRRHPSVKEAVTLLRENDNGNYLVTYVVARERNSPGYDELRNYLRTKLPNYMLPSHFVFLTALPHLPNGKVDRRALPVLECSEVSQRQEFSPPHDAVERGLVEIWEDLLGKHPIGTQDNFFDLGGHSLLVAKLLHRIEQTFSKKLSMATVFQTPRIEELASVLRNPGCLPPSSRLIPIQPEGFLPPFICLGAGSSFLPLARLVSQDQPFLGLDLDVLESTELLPPYKLEDIAAHVAKAVRDFQPKGPYYLGGWCRFGVLAYETARQILAEDEEVALLTLIDSPNPRYYAGLPIKVRIQLGVERLEYHWSNLRRSKASDMPRYVLDRLKVFRYKVGKLQARASYEFPLRAGHPRLLDLERILHLASVVYKPRQYRGRVVLFQAAERPPGQHWDLRSGWQESIEGPLEVYDIPGGHEGMFHEPQVRVLASKMRDSLLVTS